MLVGWQNIDDYWYYFAESGEMQTGWIKVGPCWYYLGENGEMQTGRLQVNGDWYLSLIHILYLTAEHSIS